MKTGFSRLAIFGFAIASAACWAQTGGNSQPAAVTFKFFWQQAHPSAYMVVIHNDG
jgi:hypothetical protein